MGRIREASPRARIAGALYVLVFVLGGYALLARGRWGVAAGSAAGLCYAVVTLLFYGLFKPVSRNLSLLAGLVSLAGCATGPLSQFHLIPRINALVIFGVYCLLIGYLIFKSTFLPHVLGALMVFAGLGWLTLLSPALVDQIAPYNIYPGLIGEGALTLWLLIKGVDVQRWREQASRGAGQAEPEAVREP